MRQNLFLPVIIIAVFSLACNFLSKKEETKVVNSNTVSETPAATNSPTPAKDNTEEKAQIDSTNYLALANGAFLVKEPNSRGAFDYAPINLIIEGMTWRSPEDSLNNQVFVIETPGETTLKNIEFDTSHSFYTYEENAKDILLEASNTNAESGFQTILETSLEKQTEENLQRFPVKAEVPARWFRLTIKNNQGSAEATSLRRIKGFGTQKIADVPQNLTGTYRKINEETGKTGNKDDYDDIFIKQDGSLVNGCWRSEGIFSGGFEGTVAKVNWLQSSLGEENSGLMIFSQNKRLVFWRLQGGKFWALERYEQVNSNLGECSGIPNFKGKDVAKSEITDELEKNGRAVIYGINFDFNSDKLRAESIAVLDKIVTVLKEKPDWKMSIEGHTDSIGGESFNKSLSEKRAKSVVDYLAKAGIDSARLSSTGFGLSKPIESNETEFGRAKNRRVELVKQ